MFLLRDESRAALMSIDAIIRINMISSDEALSTIELRIVNPELIDYRTIAAIAGDQIPLYH